MDSNIEVALATKLLKLFPPSDDSFLAFPPAGAGFSVEDLNFLETGGSADDLKTRAHRKAQFAWLMNQIPHDAVVYQAQDRILWTEYERVLSRAQTAPSGLTASEEKRLAEAQAFLNDVIEVDGATTRVYSPELKAYYQHKETYEEVERIYLDEQITVELSGDDTQKAEWSERREPELRAAKDKAMDDWLNLGHKDEVESAQAVVRNLSRKDPEVRRLELQRNVEASRELDLVANDPNGVFSTFYSPSDVFQPEAPWTQLRLSGGEVAALVAEAPPELSTWRTDAARELASLTVEYAIVVVIRPWFDPGFFDSSFWRLPDDSVVSDGQVPRGGTIPAFITNLIMARKLTVTRRKPSSASGSPGLTRHTRPWLDIPLLTALPGRMRISGLGITGTPFTPAPGQPGVSLADERFDAARYKSLTIARMRSPFVLGPNRPVLTARPAKPREGETIEEVVLDGVAVLAYRCRRIPEAPKPDDQLDWEGASGAGPTPSARARTHTVKKGESLSVIGREHRVPWREIAKLNGIKSPYMIHPDQVLKLP